MFETRYVEVYKNGVLDHKEPYQVSDEQLAQEGAEQVVGELSAKADDQMTMPEMARFLKALARLR